MARATLSRVVVFDQGLYHGNGDVIEWCRKITAKFTAEAIRYAPVRSGELVSGISGSVNHVGERQVEGIIKSVAPHTMYVLRGTKGPISTAKYKADPGGATLMLWKDVKDPHTGRTRRRKVPVRQKGFYMRIPASEFGPAFFATEVSGQRANNFLLLAWRATARNHRAIRGPVPQFITNP